MTDPPFRQFFGQSCEQMCMVFLRILTLFTVKLHANSSQVAVSASIPELRQQLGVCCRRVHPSRFTTETGKPESTIKRQPHLMGFPNALHSATSDATEQITKS